MKGVHAMPDIAKVLKNEIARISRKEVKGAAQGVRKSHTWLKKIVASLCMGCLVIIT
jgi:hypothetical protein